MTNESEDIIEAEAESTLPPEDQLEWLWEMRTNAIERLNIFAEDMTEHAYQELASVLDAPPRIAGTMTEVEDTIEAARAALLHIAAASGADVRAAAMRLTQQQARALAKVLPVFVGEWSKIDASYMTRACFLAEPHGFAASAGGAFTTAGFVNGQITACGPGMTLELAKEACENEMRRRGFILLDDLEGEGRGR